MTRVEMKSAAVICAAGYGSRMKGFSGNKSLLPLIPRSGPFDGEHPIIVEIIRNLPEGPKALVVHHRKDEVIAATRDLDLHYCDQPITNGTGGALIAARGFLEQIEQDHLIITMGDVPLVRGHTYQRLIDQLRDQDLVVLGFKPRHRPQYGLLELDGGKVKRIIEWRYWRDYPLERKRQFEVFNTGIYAARKPSLLKCLNELERRPHRVQKERQGRMEVVEEYFITDLVELMSHGGLLVGFTVAEEEQEVMGIDTVDDLAVAQRIFANRLAKRF